SMPFMEAPPALDGSMVGDVGFDPLGFTRTFDVKWMREAELKHCRICMLAVLGFVVQEIFRLPMYSGAPKLATDAHDYFVSQGALKQILLFISFFEVFGTVALWETMQGTREPGVFGFDPLNLGKNPASYEKYALSELKNGRLAMIAVGGFIHQMWVYKQGVLYQLAHFKPMS
nr:Chain 42, Chlorophyll a-b binding protein 1B-21, chloroplastic [Porphyridium purpureum]7Y5E_4N Chain 4N, Chlorophyll a-b binding protein 1B-21, chloroplastic [Porphyridium purpureum]7Y7A_47 Chain 47, Chlorophyll a-b binding protein 1B-21, chloroplastic [Porphyridium purpureum]7Y7A_4o Chain 4o, Chlorophyll a-b binding protein 1B-21, chloroplastic [Porphyridium purpureum]